MTGRQVESSIALCPASVIRTFVTSIIVPAARTLSHIIVTSSRLTSPATKLAPKPRPAQRRLRGATEARGHEHGERAALLSSQARFCHRRELTPRGGEAYHFPRFTSS